jgi:quinol monooxygenase YgiN
MSLVVVVTAFPLPEHRRGCRGLRGGDYPGARRAGVELYALHEGPDRLVMVEKYGSEQARSEHRKGAALAELRAALEGKLSSDLDAQVLVPHPAGDAQKGAL